jgi:hypothetical protein
MIEQASLVVHGPLQVKALFLVTIEPKVENLPPPRVHFKYPFFHASNPTFLSHDKHYELNFPCLSQDAIFNERVFMVIV